MYSSQALLDAEDRLLVLARDVSGPSVSSRLLDRLACPGSRTSRTLGADQLDALRSITASGRVVDVLVGPARAGKSTAMRALRQVWEAQHGISSVVGLAPSAAPTGESPSSHAAHPEHAEALRLRHPAIF